MIFHVHVLHAVWVLPIHQIQGIKIIQVDLEIIGRLCSFSLDYERKCLFSYSANVSRPLNQLLPNVAAFRRGDTIQLIEVQMQREVPATFWGALDDGIHIAEQIVLFVVTISIVLDRRVLKFKATDSTHHPDAYEGGSWVSKSKHIRLFLARKLFWVE